MTVHLKWKHRLSETAQGYRLDMLLLEESAAYLGGLVGGRLKWFHKDSLLDHKIENGRAIIQVTRTYANRKGLPKAPEHP